MEKHGNRYSSTTGTGDGTHCSSVRLIRQETGQRSAPSTAQSRLRLWVLAAGFRAVTPRRRVCGSRFHDGDATTEFPLDQGWAVDCMLGPASGDAVVAARVRGWRGACSIQRPSAPTPVTTAQCSLAVALTIAMRRNSDAAGVGHHPAGTDPDCRSGIRHSGRHRLAPLPARLHSRPASAST